MHLNGDPRLYFGTLAALVALVPWLMVFGLRRSLRKDSQAQKGRK